MDFKVAGSQFGITGNLARPENQGDLRGDHPGDVWAPAKDARINILKSMLGTLGQPREDISEHAPRLERTQIDPEKIGLLIGPRGQDHPGHPGRDRHPDRHPGRRRDRHGHRRLQGGAAAEAALARIEALTEDVKVGRVYSGTVSSVKDFGVFVEIAPGKDGLCHISELADGFVKSVADVCSVGDKMDVKVIAVDDQNRVKLSRRAVLAEAAGARRR
ncbi:MAG: hypothetical protein Ct9H300mP1_28430 [Planctomycetaceae bacterium]|nr:MAG: hypothetical protein Ct9H300mP1_28430 [Planctomycetaceae bacterium]